MEWGLSHCCIHHCFLLMFLQSLLVNSGKICLSQQHDFCLIQLQYSHCIFYHPVTPVISFRLKIIIYHLELPLFFRQPHLQISHFKFPWFLLHDPTHSAILPRQVVRPSVCDVEVLWSHMSEYSKHIFMLISHESGLRSLHTSTSWISAMGTTPNFSRNQGRSDGGISVFIPPKISPSKLLWGKNDVRMAIRQFYTPKNFYTPRNKFLATPLARIGVWYGRKVVLSI